MTEIDSYLAEEVALDHADGIITRREALRRLALLGLALPAAADLLAACARDEGAAPARSATAGPATAGRATAASATAASATAAAEAAEDITFKRGDGATMYAAFAKADTPRGGVLVIHENRGLTPHIRSVAGRFAGAGYSALAVDLLSEEGGTATVGDEAQAMAALGRASPERFVADMKAGIAELAKRTPGHKLAAIGFCFGGGMVWRLLASSERRLAAAAPFYGPLPDAPDFGRETSAAVLAVYAERDTRVNASRDAAKAALEKAGLVHEVVTFPGADHAFFNDTGPRYNAEAAASAWTRVLAWFAKYL